MQIQKLWLCEECGSPDAEVSAWCHANTGEISDADGPASWPFCGNCQAETSLAVFEVAGGNLPAAMWRARHWAAAWSALNFPDLH